MCSLESIIGSHRVIEKRELIFKQGVPFSHLFAVKSGAFKTFSIDSYGNIDINGFYLPGELIGFDCISSKKYVISCVALASSTICEIPFEKALTLASKLPPLQRQLICLMSQKMKSDLSQRINNSAEQRVAAFLLNLSKRYENSGFARETFCLLMSREDIGSYLGLAAETISRLFTQMQQKEIIKVEQRNILINDFRQLEVMAEYHEKVT